MTERAEVAEPAAPTAGVDPPVPEPAGTDRSEFRFAQHVELRTVVLPELRVLYLPIPKAGWTTVLWLLAEISGIPAETFEHSTLPGVSPALTVHDMSLWGPGRRLADYEGDERERVLTEEGWLRFSVVRDPAPRLWSAWQSKLLLREPRFLADYGNEPWFPRVPSDAMDAVEDFRRFVGAVAAGEAVDVHWCVQHDLVDRLALNHVGRLESLADTLELLKAHVPEGLWPAETRHENRTPLPLPPGVFDADAADALNRHYAVDFDEYGYDPAQPADGDEALADWRERAAPLVPLVQETIDRHIAHRPAAPDGASRAHG